MHKQYTDLDQIYNIIYNEWPFFRRLLHSNYFYDQERLIDYVSKKKNKSETEEDLLELNDLEAEVRARIKQISGLSLFSFRSPCFETSLCMGCDTEVLYNLCLLRNTVSRTIDMDKPISYYSKENRYEKQIIMFHRFYRLDILGRLNKKAILSENAQLINLLVVLFDTVTKKIMPWHDQIKRLDEINETNQSEPEGLIDTLKTINNSLLKILEGCGNKAQEEESVKFLEEKLKAIKSSIEPSALVDLDKNLSTSHF